MDELWGNAWSDPPAQNTAAEKPKPTWSGSNGPDEADIGLGSSSLAFGQPSWLTPRSPETDSNWASPSPGTTAEPPAWGKSAWTTVEDPLPQTSAEPIPQNEDEKEPQVDAWQEEEKNELDAPRESPPTVESTFPTSVAPDEVASDHRPPPISIKAPDSPEPTIPHQSPPFSSSLRRSVPPSPDTFGTFESGLMETSAVTAAWSPIGPSFGSATLAPEDAGWGSSAWDPTPTATARTDLEVQEHRDEWAAAQEEQVRREERVPQQLIDGLLAEWAELSVVLFPSENAPKDREELDLDFGLDQVEGLTRLVGQVAPQEVYIPPPIQFSSTQTYKHLRTALKQTKHLPPSRVSPMACLLASRGNSEWENAVRSRVDAVADDWSWMGGQPKEPEPPQSVEQPPVEKRSSIFSFWGRSSGAATPDLSSATATATASSKVADTATDVIPPPSPNPVSTSKAAERAPTPVVPARPSTPPKPAIGTYDTSVLEDSPSTSTAPAPSAVSRFLGRFSRNKPNVSNRTTHQVSLSASDLSFLEDVPSVTEDADPDDQLKALEDLLSSKPATIVPKLPKPLAPPPRVPSGKNSTSPSPVTPTFASAGSSKVDDMWSIFEKPAAPIPKPILGPARMASASSRASTPILPPPLAPPPKASAPSSRAATPSGSKTNSPSVGQRPMSFTAIHIRAPSTASVDPPSLDTSPQPPKPPPKHFKVDSLDDFGDFSAFLPAIASSPSSTLSPGTPHTRPSLSPIITGPTPTSTRNPLSFATFSTPVQNGLDDGFGDFMSSGTLDVNQGRPQLMSTWPNATLSPNPNQNSLPSPRITAPDTPLHATDPNKPPPPRRSLSPLMNKIAKTQSDKWPRPMSPGMLPPILAPPPGPSTTRNAVAPPAQTMSPVDLFDAPPSFLPPDHQVEPPPQANTPSMNPIPHGIPGLGFKVIQPQNTGSSNRNSLGTLSSPIAGFPPPPSLSSGASSRPSSLSSLSTVTSLSAPQTLKPVQAPSMLGTGVSANGKLSAADLSFFEGL